MLVCRHGASGHALPDPHPPAVQRVSRSVNEADREAPDRLAFLDLLRVVCVFYIVAFWHLQDYTGHLIARGTWATAPTIVVLAVFTLVSGYLTHRRGWPASRRRYVAHRFVRLYPPFALAVVAFLASGLVTGPVALRSLLLVSLLHGPAPLTIWFVVMLIDFEIVYAVIAALRASPYLWVALAAVAVGVALLYGVVGGLDARLLIYAVPFAAGILLARGGWERAWLVGAVVLLPIALLGTVATAPTRRSRC